MLTVRLLDKAEKELREAIEWYEQQGKGLGRELLEEFDKAERFLAQYPESGPIMLRDIRRTLLHTFPYSLFYRVLSQEIVVFSVVHMNRSPSRWPR
jgi:plasmid stabilization system protein ParE